MFLVVTEFSFLLLSLVQWMREKPHWKWNKKILNLFIVCVLMYQQSFDLILLVSFKFRQSIHAADAGDLFINVNNFDLWSINLNVSQRPIKCVCVCVYACFNDDDECYCDIQNIINDNRLRFLFCYQSSSQDVTNEFLFVEKL